MKKNIFITYFLIIVFFQMSFAQLSPKLSQSDVDHVLKILPELDAYITRHNIEFNEEETDVDGVIKTLEYNAKIKSFFPKYGMSISEFFEKFGIIMKAYTYLVYQEAGIGTESQMKQAMEQMKNNPYLTQEQKNQYIKEMKESMKQVQEIKTNLKKNLHPKDLMLVKKNMKKIDRVLKSLDKLNVEEEE